MQGLLSYQQDTISAVEGFIQLTACNLCYDKDKIKWEPIVSYQYCTFESDIKNIQQL